MIYHRGERRARRVLRLFQSLLRFSGAFAFSVCSAVKFKDLAISLENSTVPIRVMIFLPAPSTDERSHVLFTLCFPSI